MSRLSPQLRNLEDWMRSSRTKSDDVSREVWEVALRTKKSLSWSVVLAALLSDGGEDSYSLILRKLVGSEDEAAEITERKQFTEAVAPEDIEVFLRDLNPFRNGCASCMESPKIGQIVRIFELRLNRHAKKIQTREDAWSDDLKLKAAAQLLHATIDVYCTDSNNKALTFKSYPDGANAAANIVLFQYKSGGRDSRGGAENAFHFAVSRERADRMTSDAAEGSSRKAEAENLPRFEVRAPKLRNLKDWTENDSSKAPREVWEIGVPAKKSLPWSIVLSVLLDSGDDLASLLRKLTGNEKEMNEIMEKKKFREEVTPEHVKMFSGKFNPFKNRYTSFTQSPKMSEIVRIFDLRLKRYAAKEHIGNVWNDDLKLKAAAKLLNATIDVYFPDHIESRKFKSYPATDRKKIVLFQYEDKEHKARTGTMNVFYFAMSQKYAHLLKLDALKHFLKKAKVENLLRENVLSLMKDSNSHGAAFLPTIIKRNCIGVLPEIYKSPYIALKIFEAGFETNPIAGTEQDLSALYYASGDSDPKYLRILYDYASNCRHLFDRSARKADDDVLENLSRIRSTVDRDIAAVQTVSEIQIVEINVLNQIRRFIAYQIEVANNVKELIEHKSDSDEFEFEFRKSITVSILERFLDYFCYDSSASGNFPLQFESYSTFPEYYEYTDNFSFLCFFDNFFGLRICCGLREENVVLNIEWNMFLAMMSNRCFPKCSRGNVSNNEQNGKNILRTIPLFYRNTLGKEIKRFLSMIKPSSDSKCLKEETVAKDSISMSQIVDELVMQRLNKYIEAVFEISPGWDTIKAVLVIERALQVLGESLKPPSSNASIVSFLLRSCFDSALQIELIGIRNELSKYIDNSVYGRTEMEEDCEFFEGIKQEFKIIRKAFETVSFTQRSRIEISLIESSLQGQEKEMDSLIYRELTKEFKSYENQKSKQYEKYHDGCMKLLHDSFTDLKEVSKKFLKSTRTDNKCREIFGQLKSIEHLIMCIKNIKYKIYLDDLILDIQRFFKENRGDDHLKIGMAGIKQADEHQILTHIIKNLDPLLIKCINTVEENNPVEKVKVLAPCIGQFRNRLKTILFSSQEKQEILQAVENAVGEAKEAKFVVKEIFQKKLYESRENIDELLVKILIPFDKLSEIRKCFEEKDNSLALKYFKKNVSEDSIDKDVKDMLEKGSTISGYAFTIITKIALQRHLPSEIYASVSVREKTLEKLEFFLTKKVKFLLSRLKSMKDILIDEDKEIRGTNKWGKSEVIKYHLKFLMRQRYQREAAICASLEMAYFDCMNVLHPPSKEGAAVSSEDSLRSFSEKSSYLYAGINLRNLVSHRQNIPETVGNLLDENDFPSEMVDKMYELVGDIEAIEAILQLFLVSGVILEEDFASAIENDGFTGQETLVKDIKYCCRWKGYLSLFPFIRT